MENLIKHNHFVFPQDARTFCGITLSINPDTRKTNNEIETTCQFCISRLRLFKDTYNLGPGPLKFPPPPVQAEEELEQPLGPKDPDSPWYPDSNEPSVHPLFVSNDGHAIYTGDTFYLVRPRHNEVVPIKATETWKEEWTLAMPRFKYEHDATRYLKKTQPLISIIEIEDIIKQFDCPPRMIRRLNRLFRRKLRQLNK